MRKYRVMEGDKIQAYLTYWEDTDEYQLALTDDSPLMLGRCVRDPYYIIPDV